MPCYPNGYPIAVRHPSYSLDSACPVEACLEVLSGKWKGAILLHLSGGTLRFSDLQARLAGVTGRTLTQQLRRLEADGLVERRVFAEVPARVEYSLSPMGGELAPLIEGLRRFGQRWLESRGRSAPAHLPPGC